MNSNHVASRRTMRTDLVELFNGHLSDACKIEYLFMAPWDITISFWHVVMTATIIAMRPRAYTGSPSGSMINGRKRIIPKDAEF